MSIRFNGLMLTVTPKSTATKLRVLEFARNWVNRVSDADAEMGFFVLIIDTRDSEFGALYSDRLRGDLPGMEDTEYVQMVAPKTDINNTDESRDVVEGEDVIIDQQVNLSDEQWLSLTEKALSGDTLFVRIVNSLMSRLMDDGQLASMLANNPLFTKAVAELLKPAMAGLAVPLKSDLVAEVVNEATPLLAERVQGGVVAEILQRIESGSLLASGEGDEMSDEQIKVAVAEALPAVVNEVLPGVLDDALKRVLPSFLPNWPQLVVASVGPALVEFKQNADTVLMEYRSGMADLGELSDVKAIAQENKETADQALEQAQKNAASLSENLEMLRSVQVKVADNIQRDDEQALQLAQLLSNAKQQFDIIVSNQAAIKQGAEQAELFSRWSVSVKSSFERLDYFLLNEYDELKASLGSASADVRMLNDMQDTILKIQGEADTIAKKFGQFEVKLKDAEESDLIEELRGVVNQLSDQVRQLGAAGAKRVEEKVSEPVEEVTEEPDEFADPGAV